MADIPQNLTYDPAKEAGAMANTAALVSKIAPKRPNLVSRSPALQSLASRASAPAPAGPAQGSVPASTETELAALGPITTPYGGTTRYEKFHPAVDVGMPYGKPIPFMSPGRVIEAVGGHKQGDPGYGNYVVVEDSSGNKVKYSHLSGFDVRPGEYVQAGEQRIRAGNSGSTYSTSGGDGSHLDLRIMDMYGRYLDPHAYFSSIENYRNRS